MKRLNAGLLFAHVGGKALVIPSEGWRAHSFRLHGAAMIATMHRVAWLTQRQNTAIVARAVAAAFRRQIQMAVSRFNNTSLFGRASAKTLSTDIFLEAHEHLLLSILDEVLAETGARVTAEIVPAVQSVMAQGYSKTATLLAQVPKVGGNPNLQRRARELAGRVTGLSDTTRTRMRNLLKGSVKENLSVVETTKKVLEKMPQIQGNRALTISRTELNAAWREGSIQAFKESNTITTVSVVGCESREEDLWDTPSYQPYLYNGESTCNIQDVPVADVDLLEFHVNHTGTLVPSGFIE